MCLRRSILIAPVLAVASFVVAGGAASDQKDRRLDALFERLRAAASPEIAEPVAAEIWSIWLEAGDPTADRLLATGVTAMQSEQYDLALRAFDRLVERSPDFAEGWNKRATLLYILGRYADSVRDIARVLALEPRHFGALSGLALCDEALGKDAEALSALRRTAAIYPSMPGLRARIDSLAKKVEGEPI
jgi:tetratricopeptide (TPR) repeat protein